MNGKPEDIGCVTRIRRKNSLRRILKSSFRDDGYKKRVF
jgi:hypothetical protein